MRPEEHHSGLSLVEKVLRQVPVYLVRIRGCDVIFAVKIGIKLQSLDMRLIIDNDLAIFVQNDTRRPSLENFGEPFGFDRTLGVSPIESRLSIGGTGKELRRVDELLPGFGWLEI